ncbi:hypothetical protein [Streptomyces anulatus]|uniref:hypothetical protein n=1 Tax=Streptomyces anulatus TaxID=1892 RepID=UPI0036A55DBF
MHPTRTLLAPALARINTRIRRLMDEEHDQEQRAEEYGRLLVQWARAIRSTGAIAVS